MEALRDIGGPDYFRALALSEVPSDRTAFVGLVSKSMPTEVKGEVGGNFVLEIVNYAALQHAQAADAARTIEMPARSALLD
jgi:hypothetical protein